MCVSDMLRDMLDLNANLLSVQDDEGWTPIHCAAAESSNNLLMELLDYYNRHRNNDSSAVYAKDKEGRTILHIAILKKNWKAIENIITSSPDCVEIKDNRGQTAVHYVAKSDGNTPLIIKDLIQFGHLENLLNDADADGNTPFHILAAAILNDHRSIWRFKDLRYFINRFPFINLKAFNKKNLTFADIIAFKPNLINKLVSAHPLSFSFIY